MLCEKCQKNEATCFFSYTSSSVNVTSNLSAEERKAQNAKLTESGFIHPHDTRVPYKQLCRECARERDNELIPDGSGRTWANLSETQKQGMEHFKNECRELCRRLGFTVALQKKMLARLEKETPGIFDRFRHREKYSREDSRAKFSLMMEKLTAAVTGEFAARALSREEIMKLVSVLHILGMKLNMAQITDERIRQEFPALAPEEHEALVFLRICLHEALQKRSHRYDDNGPKAADILDVAGDVAERLYDETAREKLRQLGVVSSETLGDLVFRFIEKGILGQDEGDSIEDFKIRSAFDDFLAEPN